MEVSAEITSRPQVQE